MSRFRAYTASTALLPVFLLVLAACSDSSSSTSGAAIGDCSDLRGDWLSSEYVALSVRDDGTHSELLGLTMKLEINEQDGCHFSGQVGPSWGVSQSEEGI